MKLNRNTSYYIWVAVYKYDIVCSTNEIIHDSMKWYALSIKNDHITRLNYYNFCYIVL